MYDIWPNILTSSPQWTIENNKLINNNKGNITKINNLVLYLELYWMREILPIIITIQQ